MEKVTPGLQAMMYPMPVVIIGSMGNNNKANFTTIAWAGVVNSEPPMLGVGIRKSRHIHTLISESSVFSVNIPSKDMADQADFCGIVSGKAVDKATLCQFTIFKGVLEKAPLIGECPVNIECSVEKIIQLPSHDYFIVKIIEFHINKELIVEQGKENMNFNPIVYMKTHYAYATGNLGKPYSLGKKFLDE